MKGKTTTILSLLVFSIFVQNGYAQNADEIIEKHLKARGGIENWNDIKSMKITGFYTSFSDRKQFSEIKILPDYYYFDSHWGQHDIIEAGKADLYWTVNPWYDMSTPRRCNENESTILDQKSDFCTPFLNYKENDYAVELLGKEEMDGVEVFKLQLTRPGNDPETWYINSKTHLEHMYTSLWGDFGYPCMQETYFDDFQKVGKVLIPFYVDRVFSIRNRVVEINEVELNVEVDMKIFNLPLSDGMKKLENLSGEWSVIIETTNGSGGFNRSDSTSSAIHFISNKNLLTENISYTSTYPIDLISNWSFNTASGKYMLTVFNDFYSGTEVLLGDFSGDTLIVDNKNINIGESTEEQQLRRLSYILSDQDNFILESSISQDGGDSWMVRQRFLYSRLSE
jgi:hypothetical protein